MILSVSVMTDSCPFDPGVFFSGGFIGEGGEGIWCGDGMYSRRTESGDWFARNTFAAVVVGGRLL